MKEYKFITIRQDGGERFEGKPVYRIFNNKSGVQLGIISWYRSWRQWVFSSNENCAFNNSCLRDVLDFMENHAKDSTAVADNIGTPKPKEYQDDATDSLPLDGVPKRDGADR